MIITGIVRQTDEIGYSLLTCARCRTYYLKMENGVITIVPGPYYWGIALARPILVFYPLGQLKAVQACD